MQSRPLVNCHAAQACGSPAFAVVWQSAETDAGFEQLVVQNALRSSQLRSGGAPFPESGFPVPGGSGGLGASVQVPRWALLSCSAHVMTMPPTHAVWPHASVRLSLLCSTTQVQSSSEDDEHAIAITEKMTSERAARMARGTAKEYSRPRPHARLASTA
jgi:hypothetical protein